MPRWSGLAAAARCAAAAVCLAAAGPASALTPEAWANLQTARLSSSLDGDPGAAIAIYEALLEHQQADEPGRGQVLYWLARAHAEAGRDAEADRIMEQAARLPESRVAARTWQGHFALARRPVLSLPYVEGFEASHGHVVRGWPHGRVRDLGIDRTDPAKPYLRFATTVQDGEEDRLVIGLAPGASRLGRLRLRARSTGFEAWLQVSLVGVGGRVWSTPAIQVPTDHWRSIALDLDDFYPADPAAAVTAGRPDAIQQVQVREVTAFYARSRGPHQLHVDDLELWGR